MNEYTQPSTDSDLSPNTDANTDFKIGLRKQQKQVSFENERAIFADQKSKIEIMMELNKMRKEKMIRDRKNKRQIIISRKRQLIQGNQSSLNIDEKLDMVNFEAEKQQYLSQIDFDSLQKSKSEIYVICQKIKNSGNENSQIEGINSLNQLLVKREHDEKQIFFSSTIFQITETGVCSYLLQMLQNVTNDVIKQRLSQIFINLTLGSKREIHKMIHHKIIQIMANEIKTSACLGHIVNCIWSLSNIASTEVEHRDKIFVNFPDVFPIMIKLMDVNPNNYQLHGEIMYFTKTVFQMGQIQCDVFITSYIPGMSLLAKTLLDFDFSDPNNYYLSKSGSRILDCQADQYLYGIIQSLNSLVENELNTFVKNDVMMGQFGTQSVDNLVNDRNLFLPLMRIIDSTSDENLEAKTWKVIGFLCSCEYTPTNVQNFVENHHINLMDLICKNLTTKKITKEIMKYCLFTLSNIIADRSQYLELVLKANIIVVLQKLWLQIMESHEAATKKQEKEELSSLKTELIFCIGNCCISTRDTLMGHGAILLQEVLKQGGFIILTQALDNRNTSTLGLNIALQGISRYFRFFKTAEKENQWDGSFNDLLLEFELQGGLNRLESCQWHIDSRVYFMSQRILLKFFEIEQDDDPLIQYLNQLELENIQKCNENEIQIFEIETEKNVQNSPEDELIDI